MIYLDSNFFIYARLDKGKNGTSARKIIELIQQGKAKAATSVLAIDEVVWSVKKELGDYKKAVEYGKDITGTPNIIILPINIETLITAFRFMEIGMASRDSLHAATCLNHDIFSILSDDNDMDKVEGLKRMDFEKFLNNMEI